MEIKGRWGTKSEEKEQGQGVRREMWLAHSEPQSDGAHQLFSMAATTYITENSSSTIKWWQIKTRTQKRGR
jgi:hypothetical protein